MLKKKYYYPTDKYFIINVHPNYTGWGSTIPNGPSKYLKDSSLSLNAIPASGYNFIKWNDEDPNASRTVTVTADKEYIAIFALPNYTVTYNGNDNTGGSVPTDSHSYSSGGEVEVLGNTGNLVKTGYTFLGWTMDQGGSGTLYNAGDTFNISENTILYAQWIPCIDYITSNGDIITPSGAGFTPSGLVISNTVIDQLSGLCRFIFSSEPNGIDGAAFTTQTTLVYINIPGYIKNIGNSSFPNCTHLSSVDFGEGIEVFEAGSFSGCTALTSITIPSTTTHLYLGCFKNCTNLSTINYSGTISEWDLITKGNNWNLNVPAAVVHCTDGDITL